MRTVGGQLNGITTDFDSVVKGSIPLPSARNIRLIQTVFRFIIISLTERTMYFKERESDVRANQEHNKRERELSAERMKRVALLKKSKK